MDIGSMASGAGMGVFGIAEWIIGAVDQASNKRPEYEIPEEVKQNLSQAQQMALEGLPAEQKEQFIANVQRGTAYGLSQMNSRNAGLTGLATLNQQQNGAYQNLLAQDSAARLQNQKILMAQRQNMADYKDQQFQLNKLNPYYERTAKNQALEGAGAQNVGNSFSTFAGSSGNTGNPGESANKALRTNSMSSDDVRSSGNVYAGGSNDGYNGGGGSGGGSGYGSFDYSSFV